MGKHPARSVMGSVVNENKIRCRDHRASVHRGGLCVHCKYSVREVLSEVETFEQGPEQSGRVSLGALLVECSRQRELASVRSLG